MSTFSGLTKEFPSLSIDRFDNENLNSKIFLLSHCHTDHMIGLDNPDRPDGLQGPLYLSPVSSIIIRKQFPNIKELVVLKENEPTPIKYSDVDGITRFVTVTTVPAFHCPGSVMFLLEQDNIKVLYTGDFRLSKRHVGKIKRLKNLVGSIDTIYIDSTFLSTDYLNFPGQIRSATTICKIINEWISKNPKHVVSLKMPARYGYEALFIDIGQRLNVKIHINELEMDKYRYIPELDNIFTTVPSKSPVHACFDYHNKNGKYLTCNPDIDPSLIRVIKPTAMIWKQWNESLDIVHVERNDIVRVCYSNHSSLSEIRDFLLYLQPKSVQLNVVPSDELKKQTMLDTLAEIMSKTHSTNSRYGPIHVLRWDNLSKLSKLNLKPSKRRDDSSQHSIVCPPKRKKM